MVWKITGFLCAMLLLLWTVGLGAHNARPVAARAEASRAETYGRPANIPFPEDNPYSAAKAELGRMLFFDPRLSGSQTLSCVSCHLPGLSWGDGLPRAVGERRSPMSLRTPTLLNVAWVPILGWDGKFRDLESVAFVPITSPANMNLPEATLIARLTALPGYVRAFSLAFGAGDITRNKIELALATYERSIVSGEAPFDRWIMGDNAAIDASAKRGFEIFNAKGRCAECHSGWAFTDSSFHDIGTAQGDDIGRARYFPTSLKLRYAFKTPTLRDVDRRAPYMHDGSVPTLREVIDLYDRGGIARPSRSELMRPLGLTEDEKNDLIAFLRTLTSAPQLAAMPNLPH